MNTYMSEDFRKAVIDETNRLMDSFKEKVSTSLKDRGIDIPAHWIKNWTCDKRFMENVVFEYEIEGPFTFEDEQRLLRELARLPRKDYMWSMHTQGELKIQITIRDESGEFSSWLQ